MKAFIKTGLEKFEADANGLQKLVGIIMCTASVFIILFNSLTLLKSPSYSLITAFFDWYNLILAIIGLLGILTAVLISSFTKWLQIGIFFSTAILSALTSREGDLSSGFFFIFGLILISQYSLNRTAVMIGILTAIPYSAALTIGLRSVSSAYLSQAASKILAILCLIILYGGVLLRHELRHRKDKELLETKVKERTRELEVALEELNSAVEERSVMLAEIHHRVKNNLQVITSLLRLEAEAQKDTPARAPLEKSIQRIFAMALVHQTLYDTDQLDKIDLVAYADKLLDEARAASSTIYNLEAEGPIAIGLDSAVPFGLLLNELISNAERHAFPEGTQGKVDIGIVANENIVFTVSDNGIGISEDIELEVAKTLGLNLVKALAQQLQGKISLDRKTGTKWTVRFPARRQVVSKTRAP